MVTTALKPFKQLRFSNENVVYCASTKIDGAKRSKWFYNGLIKYKGKKAKAIKQWCDYFECNANWHNVYVNKYKNQFEVKIIEFNFKMINDILPTKLNLMRWRKVEDSNCIYCNAKVHDIKHMLWDCYNINLLWQTIANIFNLQVEWKHIILGLENDMIFNSIISLICYIIYKKYLVDKDNYGHNKNVSISDFTIKNIRSRYGFYSAVVCSAHCKVILDKICDALSKTL